MRRSSSVFGNNLHGSTVFKVSAVEFGSDILKFFIMHNYFEDKRNLQGNKMVMVQKIFNFCNGEVFLAPSKPYQFVSKSQF